MFTIKIEDEREAPWKPSVFIDLVKFQTLNSAKLSKKSKVNISDYLTKL